VVGASHPLISRERIPWEDMRWNGTISFLVSDRPLAGWIENVSTLGLGWRGERGEATPEPDKVVRGGVEGKVLNISLVWKYACLSYGSGIDQPDLCPGRQIPPLNEKWAIFLYQGCLTFPHGRCCVGMLEKGR